MKRASGETNTIIAKWLKAAVRAREILDAGIEDEWKRVIEGDYEVRDLFGVSDTGTFDIGALEKEKILVAYAKGGVESVEKFIERF